MKEYDSNLRFTSWFYDYLNIYIYLGMYMYVFGYIYVCIWVTMVFKHGIRTQSKMGLCKFQAQKSFHLRVCIRE